MICEFTNPPLTLQMQPSQVGQGPTPAASARVCKRLVVGIYSLMLTGQEQGKREKDDCGRICRKSTSSCALGDGGLLSPLLGGKNQAE
jgi:hypothetical protein